jgi:RNA polymerase sigma-70 factor, ECF subfamily
MDNNLKSDEELLSLAILDNSYFSLIIKRYQAKLLNYIKRMSSLSEEDAQDLLQDIFIKVYLHANSFDTSLKFSSWIYSIAHNQIISNYRKYRSRAEGNQIKIEDNLIHILVSDLNIEKEIDINLKAEKVNLVLNDLKKKWREVLILKYFEEKNYQEISDIIKKPEGTVASMLNTAKKEFKKIYLKKYVSK